MVVRRLENRLYRGAAYITILRRMYRGRRRLHRGSRGPSAGCPAPALQGGLPLPEGPTRQAACLGYTSHQARTCGLHVHVNRTALGDTETEQEPVIARILFFVENHWNELLRFSRRTRSQMEQWAARYGRKDDPKAVLDHAKRHEFARYKCVNLTNADTIEFRMFRGTLKWNSFLATLQMVDRICDVALFLSDQEVQDLTWTDFAASCTQPELVQYLKERRLYVNEPVAAGEEV